MLRAVCAVLLLLAWSAPARAWSTDPATPEGWALERLTAGQIANFNVRCNATLDPRKPAGWDDPCREVSARFVVDLVTQPKWQAALGAHGVRLHGAHILGSVDLSDSEPSGELWLDAGRIDGDVDVSDAHLRRLFSLDGTVLRGSFSAYRLVADSLVTMQDHAVFEGAAELADARIGGTLDMDSAHFRRGLGMGRMAVQGSVFLRDHAVVDGDVTLVGASVGSNFEADSAAFGGAFSADSLKVQGSLFLRNQASFAGEVLLTAASVGANLELSGASFARTVTAANMQVHGSLLMENHASFAGDVSLSGASVGNALAMDTASFAARLDCDTIDVHGALYMDNHAAFGGDVSLIAATVGGNLLMNSASFAKAFDADSLHVRGNMFLRDHASFAGQVTLTGAVVGGNLEMDGSAFQQPVDADHIDVAYSMFLRHGTSFAAELTLIYAKIGINLELNGASFAKSVSIGGANIKANLFMTDHAAFTGELSLTDATIGSDLVMDGASFAQAVSLDSLDVGGNLFMRGGARFAGAVNLRGSRVGGNLEMDTSRFAARVDGDRLGVRGNLYIRDHASFADELSLTSAVVGWLDLREAVATRIDLTDLSGGTGSEIQLGGLTWRCRAPAAVPAAVAAAPAPGPASAPGAAASKDAGAAMANDDPLSVTWPLDNDRWRTARCDGGEESMPALILRNVRIDALQDSGEAWPPVVDLEGLQYNHLGGLNGVGRADMRQRTPAQWVNWLEREAVFSPQPYTQLAAVLAAAGRRDAAEAILYAGRERERHEIWHRQDVGSWRWIVYDLPAWVFLSVFALFAGYGIGLYTFRVAWWVIALTAVGAFLLRYSPYARTHSLWWRIGASLHRLLPIVELNKEFQDFFDNTPEPGKPVKLLRWQKGFYTVVALTGWVLGSILLAALGGLTAK
jgi:hypothetical protein